MKAYGTDPVTLRVNGLEYAGVGGQRWNSVTITESLESLARDFTVGVVGVFASEPEAIEAGDSVEVWVGRDKLLTGWVDDHEVGGDARTESVTANGRSLTGDLADCSAPPGTWSGLTVAKLVQALTEPYRIELVDQAGVGSQVVSRWRTEDGEFIFDGLDRLGRSVGALVTDDGAGRLVLTTTGTARCTDAIERGRPGFISGSVKRSQSERYSKYSCHGQVFTDLEVDPHAVGYAEDTGITRYRELIIRPERGMTKAEAAARARWEASTRAAKSLVVTVTVRGWRQSDGSLWRANMLVTYTDKLARIDRAELLIVDVIRTLDANGRVTTMRLMPEEAFRLPPGEAVTVAAGTSSSSKGPSKRPHKKAPR